MRRGPGREREYRFGVGLSFAVLFGAGVLGCAPTEAPPSPELAEPTVAEDPASADGATPTLLTHEEGVPPGGVELGWGWDSRRGEVVPGRCVEFAPIRSTGQVATLNLKEVSDQSEVMDSLGVSASVSVRTMFASGSAQASFARDSKVSSTSTNLVLRATVDNGVFFAGPRAAPALHRPAFGEPPTREEVGGGGSSLGDHALSLKPWAERLLDNPNEFRKSCGDSYVSSISSGAQLIALIQFSSNSSEDKRQIKAAVSAEFGPVALSSSLEQSSSQKLSSTNLEMSFLQVGGGAGILPTDRETLLQKVRELAIEAARDPKFHSMWVTPYESLPGWRGGLLKRDRDEDEIIADYYWFLTSLYRDVEEILSAPRLYRQGTGLSTADLRQFQDGILALRSTLWEVMRAKRDSEIPQPAPTANDLRLLPAFEGDLAETLALPTATSVASWHAEFNEAIRRAIPFGNPNVLKLRLPIPAHQAPGVEIPNRTSWARAAVDWYIRPQSIRMCELDPTDNECLSNAEMEQLIEVLAAEPPADERN